MLDGLFDILNKSGEPAIKNPEQDKVDVELPFALDLEEDDSFDTNEVEKAKRLEMPTQKSPGIIAFSINRTPSLPIAIPSSERRSIESGSESDSDSDFDSFSSEAVAEYFLNHRRDSQKLSESMSVGSPPKESRTPKIKGV